MTRDFGKNRAVDFARFANLGSKRDLTESERAYLIEQSPIVGDGTDEDRLEYALVESERMYRACCLMAFGSPPPSTTAKGKRTHAGMLASWSDVELFASAEMFPMGAVDEDGVPSVDASIVYEAVLPCLEFGSEKPEPLAPKSYYSPLYFTPIEIGGLCQTITESRKAQTYSLIVHEYGLESKRVGPRPFKMLAQVIANTAIRDAYIGVFDGRPVFEPRSGIELLWQTVAELSERQAPGICPACGKVIDRRRGESGGQPLHTCPEHQEKFRSLKRSVRNSAEYDPKDVRDGRRCEEAVRELRRSDPILNERPLRFLSTAKLPEGGCCAGNNGMPQLIGDRRLVQEKYA